MTAIPQEFLDHDKFVEDTLDTIKTLQTLMSDRHAALETKIISFYEDKWGVKNGERVHWLRCIATNKWEWTEATVKLEWLGKYIHEVRLFVVDEHNKDHYVCSPFNSIKKLGSELPPYTNCIK
jgi:hypothetical protein